MGGQIYQSNPLAKFCSQTWTLKVTIEFDVPIGRPNWLVKLNDQNRRSTTIKINDWSSKLYGQKGRSNLVVKMNSEIGRSKWTVKLVGQIGRTKLWTISWVGWHCFPRDYEVQEKIFFQFLQYFQDTIRAKSFLLLIFLEQLTSQKFSFLFVECYALDLNGVRWTDTLKYIFYMIHQSVSL